MVSDRRNQIAMALIILVLIILPTIKEHSFSSVDNFRDIGISTSYVFIAAIGMLLVIVSGDIDVSIGAVLAITGAVAGTLAKGGAPVPIILGGAILTGSVLGLINGLLISVLRIQSIIATLGTMSLFRGMFIIVTHGKWVTSLPETILQIGRGKLVFLPIPIFIALLVSGIFNICSYLYTIREKYLLQSARIRKQHVLRVLMLFLRKSVFFVANGALLGLASVIFAGRYGSIQSNTGTGFEMIAITAVIVGGASIAGGAGTVIGTLLGSILITMISTVLIFFGISAFWVQTVQGIFILLAVLYYTIVSKRSGIIKR